MNKVFINAVAARLSARACNKDTSNKAQRRTHTKRKREKERSTTIHTKREKHNIHTHTQQYTQREGHTQREKHNNTHTQH